MLRGEDLPPDVDELGASDVEPSQPVEVEYNPAIPIEAFDVVIVDECHRSIYGASWRRCCQVKAPDALRQRRRTPVVLRRAYRATASTNAKRLGDVIRELVEVVGHPELTLERSSYRLRAARGLDGDQSRDRLATARDHDLGASLGFLEQL